MKRVLVILILLVFSLPVFGAERSEGLDYRLGAGARSLPLGAAAYGEVGYNSRVWGNFDEGFFYGYVRPSLSWTSAVTINELNPSLRVSPISILGITFGKVVSYRLKDQSSIVECGPLLCDGVLRATHISADLTVGFGKFFLIAEGDLREFNASDASQPFYEDGAALIGRNGEDRQATYAINAGGILNERTIAGITVKAVEFHDSGQRSERASLFTRIADRDFAYSLVAGIYRSDVVSQGLALGVAIEWKPIKGLEL